MSEVFTAYYELTGSSFDTTEVFHAEREDALREWVSLMQEIGAISFQPNRAGEVYAAEFVGRDVPDGWRNLSYKNGNAVCAPHKGRKAGKEVSSRLKGLPPVHSYTHAIKAISPEIYGVTQIKNGNTLCRTTGARLHMPKVSFIASVPRSIGDNLKIPSDWVELTEGAYSLFFHEHNAEAAKNRAQEGVA